ncbi:MAG: FKBP-type peptidyl-prolyl cis-trans isomerase [Prolixibacteraceae bacterium]|nr:FKBP-type peptidyl-prolyl cis-trans isomerase [Prolixibacteraceae bacterium]
MIAVTIMFAACSSEDASSDAEIFAEAREKIDIEKYLAKIEAGGKYKIDTTELGVFYYFKEHGVGDYPRSGDTLSIVFDTFNLFGILLGSSRVSQNDSIYRFVYKSADHYVRGWDEMMGYLNKGARVEFIVPYELAFGADRFNNTGTTSAILVNQVYEVPPFTSLIFKVLMKDIVPPVVF